MREGAETRQEGDYPHLIIRLLAAVYSKRTITFVEQETGTSTHPDAYVTVVCPDPFRDGNLTDKAKEALVEAVKRKVNENRIPACIVFGKGDLLYVNPNGETKLRAEAPSGGLWFTPRKPG